MISDNRQAGKKGILSWVKARMFGESRSAISNEPQATSLPIGRSQIGNDDVHGLRAIAFLDQVRRDLQQASEQDTAVSQNTVVELQPFDVSEAGPGESIGRFRIKSELGKGGFATVYLAHDPTLRRDVALKRLRDSSSLSRPEIAERFDREARAAAMLCHPNIAPVFESGMTDGVRYIVSGFCDGPTLQQWMKLQTEPIRMRTAARIVAILAEAVGHAHQRGILHRDLKPANILVQKQNTQGDLAGFPGVPLIADFGLARLVDGHDPLQTIDGTVIGTPVYMSPEQTRGAANAGPGVDIHALGVLLYEMLTGEPPFHGKDNIETMLMIARDPARPPHQLRSELPRDLEAICLKCLEKSPTARYTSAHELHRDLNRWLSGRPVQARQLSAIGKTWKWCRRNPALATAFGAVCVAFCFAVYQWNSANQQWQLARQEQQRAERNMALAGEAIRDLATRTAHSPSVPLDIRSQVSDQALEFQLRLLAEDPQDPELRFQAAVLWNNVAHNLHDERKFDESIAAAEHVRQLLSGLPSEIRVASLKSSNLQLMANGLRNLGRHAEGLMLLESQIDEDEPPHAMAQRFTEASRGFQAAGDLPAARTECLKAVLVWENTPPNIFTQAGLADSLWELGLVEFELGDLDSALHSLLAAREIHKDISSEMPFHETHEEQVGRVLRTLGTVQRELGETAAARQNLESSIEQFSSLHDWNSEVPRYAAQLFSCRNELLGLLYETKSWTEFESLLVRQSEAFAELDTALNEYSRFSMQLANWQVDLADHFRQTGGTETADSWTRRTRLLLDAVATQTDVDAKRLDDLRQRLPKPDSGR